MRADFEKIPMTRQESFACREFRRWDRSWHYHPEYELTLIAKGRGRRMVGDSIADYREGDLVFLAPTLPHFWRMDTRHRAHAVVVQFLGSCLGEGFFERPEMHTLRRLFLRSKRGLRFTGETRDAVAEKMHGLLRLADVQRIVALLSILDILARSREVRALSSRGFVPYLDPSAAKRINKVSEFVHKHFAGPIHQPQVAAVARMTPPAFSRFFKKTMGKTFSEFVNELRISSACRSLIESDLNITEICYDCGFENLSNFNRRFRLIKECSPREFRRRFRHAAEAD